MAEPLPPETSFKENKIWKAVIAVSGIMTTLVIYGILQACRFTIKRVLVECDLPRCTVILVLQLLYIILRYLAYYCLCRNAYG